MTQINKESAVEGTQNKKGYSLSKLIALGLGILVAIVIVLAISTYYRLNTFKQTLENVSEKSLATVISSGEIFTQVNTLASISERLVNANSDPFRRISYSQINDQLIILRELADSREENSYMLLQLYTISRELADLNQLVINKINVADSLLAQQANMYGLYEELMLLESDQPATMIKLSAADIVTRTSEILIVDRLNQVREKKLTLESLLKELEEYSVNAGFTNSNVSLIVKELNDTILNPINGIVSLRQEQLRVAGRARGRSNMVHNLIVDYARLAEFESHQLNARVLEDAKNASKSINNQIQNIHLVFIFIVVTIIGFSLFVNRFVVSRLLKLRMQIHKRMDGNYREIKLTGNDEISELARAFDSFARTIETQKQTLSEMSLRDALTGIANRRALDERFKQEISSAMRHQWPLSVLLLDIDYFKQYNDNYGHGRGDQCLKDVADILRQYLPRQSDMLARFGGEEFAIILPDTNAKGADSVANNIISGFNAARLPHEYSQITNYVTISIGVATHLIATKEKAWDLFDNADKALYCAKKRGRNRSVSFGDISSQPSNIIDIRDA